MAYNETVLALPTVILACLSVIACLSVCISICRMGYIQSSKSINTQTNIIKLALNQPNIIVFWMCIVDGFHMIQIILNWSPQLVPSFFNNSYWNDTGCLMIGVYAQFTAIQGAFWHILLAYYLGIPLSFHPSAI